MNRWRVASLLLASFLAGCVATDVTILTPNNRPYPEVPVDTVRVFLDASEIPTPYERVAIIYAHGDAGLTNPAQMIEAARKKAASLGANGVLVGDMNEPSSGESLGAKTVSPLLSGDRRGSALAVRYGVRPAEGSRLSELRAKRRDLVAEAEYDENRTGMARKGRQSRLGEGSGKHGFYQILADIRWGDAPTASPNPGAIRWGDAPTTAMAFRGTNAGNGGALYDRTEDILFVGRVPLTDIYYEFWDGHLRAVSLEARPDLESALIAELTRAWRRPREVLGTPGYDNGYLFWVRPGEETGALLGKGAAELNWPSAHVMIFDQKFFDEDRRVNGGRRPAGQ